MDDEKQEKSNDEVIFKDESALLQWLTEQSTQVRSAFSSRYALRVLASIAGMDSKRIPEALIAVLRAILLASIRGSSTTFDPMALQRSILNAAKRSNSIGHSIMNDWNDPSNHHYSAFPTPVLNAVHAATDSAILAATTGEVPSDGETFAELFSDDAAESDLIAHMSAAILDSKNHDLVGFTHPVWNGVDIPIEIENKHKAFLDLLDSDESTWGFWTDWYLAMWGGRFENWDFAAKVARIPEDVWVRGAVAVAAEIRKIADEHIIQKLPQVEEVFENEQGLYDTRPTVAEPSKLIDSILKRLDFALETALSSNMCDLNAMSLPAKLLRHVLLECADDPNSIEQYFRQASALIKKKVQSGQFAEDDELTLLVSVLDETALQLRADHPDVAAAAEARVGQTLREIDEAKRIEIANSIEDMQEGSAPRLAAEFSLAAETTRSDGPHEAQASAIKMSSERAAKISIAERAKKVEGSGAMSALKIGLRGNRLVQLVIELMSGGF